jgi:hydrogenase expression/formation protein HypC
MWLEARDDIGKRVVWKCVGLTACWIALVRGTGAGWGLDWGEAVMCLAVPAQVEALLPGDRARVSVGGIRKDISVALLDDVAPGEFVILHVGYALGKIDEDEAERTLKALMDGGIDLVEELGLEPQSDPAPSATYGGLLS